MKNYFLYMIALIMVLSSCDIETIDPEDKNVLPAATILKYPVNNAEMVSGIETTIAWDYAIDEDGFIQQYYLYFGKENNMQLLDSTTRNRYTIDTLENETRYYWQIEAVDDKGGKSMSEVWSFTSDDHTAVPTPVYPADGDVDVSIPITFKWDCKNAAISGGELYLSEVGGGDYIMIPDNEPYANLKPGTTYHWWIIGYNGTDRDSPNFYVRGNMAEFTTKE